MVLQLCYLYKNRFTSFDLNISPMVLQSRILYLTLVNLSSRPPMDEYNTRNGYKTKTKRTSTVQNGRLTDVQRTFYPLNVRSKFSTGQNGRRRIKRTLNGYATDMDGRLKDKNGRLTDMNGLKKSYPLGVCSSIR